MKRAFTLLELIVVIIILGILATIATEILLKVYKNYAFTKATNTLAYETDLVLNNLASKLENRIPNSVIATECNVTNNDCKNGNVLGFISISELNASNASRYPVIEWINKDIYSKRGEWDSGLKRVIPGWSGFVDLKRTQRNSKRSYTIIVPYSKMSLIQDIEGNFTKSWGVDGYDKVFDNNLSVLIFSGPNGRGDFNDINHSYGWYKVLYPNNKAEKIYSIHINDDSNFSETNITITSIDDTNNSTVYEGFFVSNGAMAIVPVYNSDTNDYNLTLIQNYFPWKNQKYTDGNSSLLASHVTKFKFKEQNGLLRIYLCIQNPAIDVGENDKLTVCKERIVF